MLNFLIMKQHISFKIMRTVPVICFFTCSIQSVFGQKNTDLLFNIHPPLEIGLRFSIKEIRKSKEDSAYINNILYYQNASGSYDSLKIGIKGRGNFRMQGCYFPPLWIKLPKKKITGTVFEGNKKLKLVLPCDNKPGNNALILKEYLCYKLYEVITPYFFKSGLTNIDFTELRGKTVKHFQLKGIFIEDLEKMAQRFQARPLGQVKFDPMALQDTGALRFAFFQYMIANTDWSRKYQHNTKLIRLSSGDYISIPYDFDMSGVVDAPYSLVSLVGDEELNIKNVRERLYRGWCRSEAVTQFVRNEFLSKQAELLSIPDMVAGELPDKEIKAIKDYLKFFFETIKDEDSFKENIIDQCRNAD